MTLIDSHCHLFYDEKEEQLSEKIENANAADVQYMLSVSTTYENSLMNLSIAKGHQNICCAVGVHPNDFAGFEKDCDFRSLIEQKEVVAIGEIGLDYSDRSKTSQADQVGLLRWMFEMSLGCGLPYIIHARDCFPDILDVIGEYPNTFGVFHCFTDTIDNVRKILDIGYYVSFSGIITFKNSVALREVLKFVPDDRLLLETDSPYLSPVPFRGRANEPAYLKFCASCAAEVRGTTFSHIAQTTTQNFFKLFERADFLLE